MGLGRRGPVTDCEYFEGGDIAALGLAICAFCSYLCRHFVLMTRRMARDRCHTGQDTRIRYQKIIRREHADRGSN